MCHVILYREACSVRRAHPQIHTGTQTHLPCMVMRASPQGPPWRDEGGRVLIAPWGRGRLQPAPRPAGCPEIQGHLPRGRWNPWADHSPSAKARRSGQLVLRWQPLRLPQNTSPLPVCVCVCVCVCVHAHRHGGGGWSVTCYSPEDFCRHVPSEVTTRLSPGKETSDQTSPETKPAAGSLSTQHARVTREPTHSLVPLSSSKLTEL